MSRPKLLCSLSLIALAQSMENEKNERERLPVLFNWPAE
jgi:hypothetical protein